jgi:lipopolysaccharide/colanic/teichoic acid biosynthesis glycosyltransferase
MLKPAKRVMFIRTASMTFLLLRGQLKYFREAGYDVTFVSAPGPEQALAAAEGARVFSVGMRREPSLFGDLRSLWRLWRLIRHERPELVEAGSPKAGLLANLAARFASVPVRVYTLMGLRLETLTGISKRISVFFERVACGCADAVLCVSPSLRERAIGERLASPKKLVVLGSGSSRGVNIERFQERPSVLAAANEWRSKLNVRQGDFVIGFIGRLVRDKGIVELVEAFQTVRETLPAKLVLVGEYERGTGNTLSHEFRDRIESDPDISQVPWVDDPAPIYHMLDVLALPTYREGFPNAALEAQASSRPVITTNATGAVDSIVDGSTGMIVPVGDAQKLAEALLKIGHLPDRGRSLGKAGHARVEAQFDEKRVWEARLSFFDSLLRTATRQRGFGLAWKWIFDRVFACVLLVALSPVLLAVGSLVLFTMGWPILFRQPRLGRYGETIYVHKFRTMSEERDADGTLLPDAQRLGSVGRMLRRLSLDELPQLWDVFRGAISFVGPRPLLVRYKDRYSPEQWRRHNVFQGITGWAQVNGRNAISWEEKFNLDVWYVDHWSLWLDMKILLRTVGKVARRQGISRPGHETAPEFEGARSGVKEVISSEELPRYSDISQS